MYVMGILKGIWGATAPYKEDNRNLRARYDTRRYWPWQRRKIANRNRHNAPLSQKIGNNNAKINGIYWRRAIIIGGLVFLTGKYTNVFNALNIYTVTETTKIIHYTQQEKAEYYANAGDLYDPVHEHDSKIFDDILENRQGYPASVHALVSYIVTAEHKASDVKNGVCFDVGYVGNASYFNRHGINNDYDLRGKTLGQWLDVQKNIQNFYTTLNAQKKKKGEETVGYSTALGAGQFMYRTLTGHPNPKKRKKEPGLIDKYDLDLDMVMTEDAQLSMIMLLLIDAGLEAFLSKDIGTKKFADNIAKIWAGVPGKDGLSKYHGINDNKASKNTKITYANLIKILDNIKSDQRLTYEDIKLSLSPRL
jgi:hypothetical protein